MKEILNLIEQFLVTRILLPMTGYRFPAFATWQLVAGIWQLPTNEYLEKINH